MKYFLRAVKYFVMISLLLTVIMTILVMINAVDSNPQNLFRDGWNSVVQIALLFALFSAIYPKFGYCSRETSIAGEYSEIRDGVVDYMDSRGYSLEKEENENMSFRSRSTMTRITKFGEDRITMTRRLGGFTLEGITKEVNRLASGLEYKFRNTEEDES